jgi:hypothetical protein
LGRGGGEGALSPETGNKLSFNPKTSALRYL